MRADVQSIFYKTPHDKQVMMFSATLKDCKETARKFMQEVLVHPHPAIGDLHQRRVKIDSSWTSAILRELGGEREEQETH